ncbi:hypothetical protein N657DRAFT_642263 [Parathielavia appendiculata]|uniref:Uncharacterized protein n=1 Tax=Parathielavia appendiculata TaxID=2587402 RepID=A0AAN6U468_9PEZI|nr:hypothetical protein N657DRAFT_642263 [Parathielavia appendiculata]
MAHVINLSLRHVETVGALGGIKAHLLQEPPFVSPYTDAPASAPLTREAKSPVYARDRIAPKEKRGISDQVKPRLPGLDVHHLILLVRARVDGADEQQARLSLTKGLGALLFQPEVPESIFALLYRMNWSKLSTSFNSPRLGSFRWPVSSCGRIVGGSRPSE